MSSASTITACGTASYAGAVAKYWFERLARIPVDVDIASEFRYREAPLRKGDLAIFISQSGETADTLAALALCQGRKGRTRVSVVNVPTSTIARESETVLPTLAGPEIGVASTKAFTCQLTALAAFAVAAGAGARRIVREADEARLVQGADRNSAFDGGSSCHRAADREAGSRPSRKRRDVLYLGRGTSYPLALEGALKLKEISYIHAEGYAAGELKHGPIALIDENMPVVVIAPFDRVFEKTVSNMQEVAARGGKIILMTDAKGAAEAAVESLGHDSAAGHGADLRADRLRRSGPVAGLSYGRDHGHRCRPAAQSRQIGDGGIGRMSRHAVAGGLQKSARMA